MANEIYDNTWFGNTIDTASSIGTSTEMIQGQINMNKLGDDLVVNGDFATDSDWLKLNATISGGKGNLDGDGQTSLLYQNILTQYKYYKLTFTISNYNELGEARAIDSNGSSIYTITENGTFTINFQHTNSIGDFYFRARFGAIYSIDNVSVQQVRAYRPIEELVKNGDFATDSDWVLGANTTISSGVLNFNSASSNTDQSLTTTNNITYKVIFSISNYVSGSVRFRFTGNANVNGISRDTNGTFTQYITSTADNSIFRFASSSFIGSIDNVSVKQADQDEVEAKKCLADAIHRIGLQDIQN